MDTSGAGPRWFHAWQNPLQTTPAAEPDCADQGTAFGLDMSLMDLVGPGLGCDDEPPRRTSDEGLEGADDPRRAWAR